MRISDWSSDVCSSDLRKTVMSSARNFYVIGVTGDPETVGIMEQPRERIDIRCLEGAADPDRRSGRIGHDNLAAIIAIELRGDLRQRSEESRVGTECVITCSSRCAPYH